ncbi:peptidase M16 [Pseudomonas lundensis]|uniref:M16 family metallopeptidase n=1 Tax=Pseudomonas lundensis TaxID=86185 RepID=UPI0006421B1B|nr:pitrilysin family protein [Pseudomonas lundensis]AOZ12762.1 peptidase M16 [Pseudomonas lundensis]QVQ76112.1 insulinase family protein [Pseudomonas lundensis]
MRPLLAALVFGVMLQPLLAFASRPPSIHEFMLDNGLKLIVYEDHHAPLVHSHLWYRIGSNQEGPGQTGLSHALEHMLFNGSSKLCSGESDQILQHLSGSENATTLNDATLYFHTLPAHALGVSFEILADQMSTAHLSATQWGGEREVIKNERSESFENHPLRRALELPRRLALPASAAGNPVIGWRHDLDRLQIEDLKHWYGHWYAPNNAVLVVTGDVDAQQVKQLAERYFGPIARRPLPYSPAPLELPTPGERRITQYIPHQIPVLYMAFNVPSLKTQADPTIAPALELLSELLAGANSSLFKTRLAHQEGLVSGITVHYTAVSQGDELFSIRALPDLEKAGSMEAVKTRILALIDTLKTAPPRQQDLDRARVQITARRVFDQDELSNRALQLGEQEMAGLDWRSEQARLDTLKAITPQDVQRVVRTFLATDRLTTSYALPEEMPHE